MRFSLGLGLMVEEDGTGVPVHALASEYKAVILHAFATLNLALQPLAIRSLQP